MAGVSWASSKRSTSTISARNPIIAQRLGFGNCSPHGTDDVRVNDQGADNPDVGRDETQSQRSGCIGVGMKPPFGPREHGSPSKSLSFSECAILAPASSIAYAGAARQYAAG